MSRLYALDHAVSIAGARRLREHGIEESIYTLYIVLGINRERLRMPCSGNDPVLFGIGCCLVKRIHSRERGDIVSVPIDEKDGRVSRRFADIVDGPGLSDIDAIYLLHQLLVGIPRGLTRSRRDAPGFSHGEESRAARRQSLVAFHQFLPLAILVKMWYTCSMKVALTAKLKLLTTPEQFKQLRATQLAYRDALNYVSRYAKSL